jgi:phosphomevalonate kinase
MADGSNAFLVRVTAPGKLLLAGEYAVLDGAPAICAAVDRRAIVTIAASPEACHVVTAPGFAAEPGRFRAAGGGVEWLGDGGSFALVEAVWALSQPDGIANLSLELDSRAFVDADSGVKLGFGSSSAVAVALAHAVCALAPAETDAAEVAFEAHRQLQAGLGSGVDVACSRVGGLIEYSMQGAATRHIDWPDGLEMGVVWVGVPASTRDKLLHLLEQPAVPSRDALVLASQRLAGAWRRGTVAAILDEYRDYAGVLREFENDHALGIYDAGHAELAALAAHSGVIYKPCGAGGGDTGVVLADDPTAVDAFLEAAAEMGFSPLDVAIDDDGVRMEGGRP